MVAEWEAIGRSRAPVQLQFADWYYTLQGPVADSAELWRVMLWKIRRKLEGGSFAYAQTLWSLDLPGPKRFELNARFQLARCEHDREALLALARKYPSWREPGEEALRLK